MKMPFKTHAKSGKAFTAKQIAAHQAWGAQVKASKAARALMREVVAETPAPEPVPELSDAEIRQALREYMERKRIV
jgi:hypothetical protein